MRKAVFFVLYCGLSGVLFQDHVNDAVGDPELCAAADVAWDQIPVFLIGDLRRPGLRVLFGLVALCRRDRSQRPGLPAAVNDPLRPDRFDKALFVAGIQSMV